MSHSQDLRERVMKFAEEHGKSEAARVFKITRTCLYRWKKQPLPLKPGPRAATKLDMAALERHVAQHNDAYLAERAAHFGVTPQAIWYALKRLDMRKKNVAVHGKM
jgi:transposase